MKSARNASREMLAAHVPACLSTSLALCQHGPKSDATWTPKYMRVHFTNWAHSFRKSWPWTRAGHHHHHRGGSALVQPPQLCISDHSMNGQPDSTSIIIDGRPISLVRVCVQDLLIRYIVQLGHASHLLIREKHPNSLCTEAECSKTGREHVLEDCSDYIILHLLVISFHAKQRNAFNLCVFANPQYRGKHTKNANLFVVARKVIVVHIFD